MELYPAIDLREGRCVRLLRGDYDRETHYGDDPAAQARRFVEAGATRLHVVDLDAARTGTATNRAAIAEICAAVEVPVQCGGGVRTAAAAAALASIGVARVVVGTAAVEHPEVVGEIASVQPVAVGLDARGREVATRGWEQASGADLLELAVAFEGIGVEALVVTEIGRDGTLEGPDLGQLSQVLAATSIDVIASGGVGSVQDIRSLAALEVGGRRLAGAIIGRALYEGTVELPDALEAAAR